MTDADILRALTNLTALALTMWGEGRGDWREGHSSVEERLGVGCVIRNRTLRDTANYRNICLAPSQFSCWTKLGGAANYAALMALAERVVLNEPSGDPIYTETLFLAQGIIAGVILDRTGGATSYYAPAAMMPVGRVPKWAVGKTTIQIGEQLFLHA